MNPIRRIRRIRRPAAVLAVLAAALAAFGTPLAFGSTHPGTPPDSGLAACAYPLSTHHVTAADYRQIRAQFAGSRSAAGRRLRPARTVNAPWHRT